MDITKIKKTFQPELEKVDAEIRKSLDSPVQFIGQVASYLINSGGKRFRPLILIISAHAFRYKGKRIHEIASTLEFIHTATLLHDDVVDSATLRRGKSSANVLWGNEATVLVGDFLLARSFLKLVQDGDIDVLDCVSRATTKMAEGEILQLLNTNEPATSEDKYFEVVRSKTAVLISAASEIGAILGGSSRKQRENMRDYGMLTGISFQITDDTLDYLTEDATSGKTQGQDFFDGKVTLPFIYAYSKSTAAEKELLSSLLLKQRKTRTDFRTVFKLIESKGAFPYCFEKSKQYVHEAKKKIGFLDPLYREYLETIADYIVDRTF